MGEFKPIASLHRDGLLVVSVKDTSCNETNNVMLLSLRHDNQTKQVCGFSVDVHSIAQDTSTIRLLVKAMWFDIVHPHTKSPNLLRRLQMYAIAAKLLLQYPITRTVL